MPDMPSRKYIIDTKSGVNLSRIGLVELREPDNPYDYSFGLVYQSPGGKNRYLARLKNLAAADVCLALRKMADEISEHDLGVKEVPPVTRSFETTDTSKPPVICTNCGKDPATVNGNLCPACYTIANEP